MSEPRTDRPVRLVLDSTAVVAFSRGSLAVGEVLAEIGDEHATAVLPYAVLVDAVPAVADTARVELLAAHHAVELWADDPAEWQAHAAMREIVGRPDAAAAALVAVDFDANVLTRTPGVYGGLNAGRMVIEIED